MVKKSQGRKMSEEDMYDWMVMPDSYFAAALLCCEALLHSGRPPDIATRRILGNKAFTNFRSPHKNYELIRPLVFNFKQGIELYVKGLAGMLVGEYIFNHDIRDIFEQAIQLDTTSPE